MINKTITGSATAGSYTIPNDVPELQELINSINDTIERIIENRQGIELAITRIAHREPQQLKNECGEQKANPEVPTINGQLRGISSRLINEHYRLSNILVHLNKQV